MINILSIDELTKSKQPLSSLSWETAISDAESLIRETDDLVKMRRLRLAVEWFQQMLREREPFPGEFRGA